MALAQSVGQSIAHQRAIVAVPGDSKEPDRREGAVAAGGQEVAGSDGKVFFAANRRPRSAPE